MVFFHPGLNIRIAPPVDSRTTYSQPYHHHNPQSFQPSPHIDENIFHPGPGSFSPSYPTAVPLRGVNKVPDFFPQKKLKVSSDLIAKSNLSE